MTFESKNASAKLGTVDLESALERVRNQMAYLFVAHVDRVLSFDLLDEQLLLLFVQHFDQNKEPISIEVDERLDLIENRLIRRRDWLLFGGRSDQSGPSDRVPSQLAVTISVSLLNDAFVDVGLECLENVSLFEAVLVLHFDNQVRMDVKHVFGPGAGQNTSSDSSLIESVV